MRSLARRSRCAEQTRRLLALAAIYDGSSRGEAARIGDTGLQTIRDWVLRFNTAGPAGLITRKPPGRSAILSAEQRQAVLQVVEAGPMPAIHDVVRWRLMDLARWLGEKHGVAVPVQTLSRELRALGLRRLSARPQHHAQKPEEQALFKRTSAPVSRLSRHSSPTPR